jgi:hypothetical protein
MYFILLNLSVLFILLHYRFTAAQQQFPLTQYQAYPVQHETVVLPIQYTDTLANNAAATQQHHQVQYQQQAVTSLMVAVTPAQYSDSGNTMSQQQYQYPYQNTAQSIEQYHDMTAQYPVQQEEQAQRQEQGLGQGQQYTSAQQVHAVQYQNPAIDAFYQSHDYADHYMPTTTETASAYADVAPTRHTKEYMPTSSSEGYISVPDTTFTAHGNKSPAPILHAQSGCRTGVCLAQTCITAGCPYLCCPIASKKIQIREEAAGE